ncbi:MAG: hypothetical protein UT37_C0003G0007 [Parcubacteria group bacterium GW2011_GWA2_39_18]|nr:MAG: hypothetical protein UT37_C0003G0007 [Parcubacteria group bacterium GW2011_GWA2_39_18]
MMAVVVSLFVLTVLLFVGAKAVFQDDQILTFILLVFAFLLLVCFGVACYNMGAMMAPPKGQILTVRTSYSSPSPKENGATIFLVQVPRAHRDYKVFEKELSPETDPASLVPGTQIIKINGRVYGLKNTIEFN